MKNHIYLILAAVLLLCSCAHEPRKFITGSGGLDLTISINKDINKQSEGIGEFDIPEPNISNFLLQLTDEEGNTKSLGTYAQFDSRHHKLPVGKYTLSITGGDLQPEGFGKITFRGENEIVIRDSETTSVNIECGIYNAFCADKISNIPDKLTDLSIRVKSQHGQYVELSEGDQKAVSFIPGKVSAEISLTDRQGHTITLRPFSFDARSAEFYRITASGNGNSIDIAYNKATETEPFKIELTNELFTSKAPVLTTEKKTYQFVSGQNSENCIVNINSDSGLKAVYMTILSSPRGNNIYSDEADILPEYAEPGAKNAVINLTDIISALGTVDDTNTEYTVILQAEDIYGRVANTPCAIKVTVKPIVLLIGKSEPIDLDAKTVTVALNYNGTDYAHNVSFEYSPDGMDWRDATIVEIYPKDELYHAVINTGDEDARFYLRAKSGAAYSDKALITRLLPSFTATCTNENIWSSKADIYIDGERASSFIRFVKVLIKEEGEEWHPAVIERFADEKRITVSTLMPSAKYQMAVTMDGKQVFNFDFTTEAALDLPNSSFEDDHKETINIKSINCGGKYSNINSWTPVYNRASIFVEEADGWASINAKTCSKHAQTSNTWFKVPTTEIVKDGFDGAFAVKLRNAAWDIHGVEPPKDTRTDKLYYSRNVPAIKNKSAGKIFLGTYRFGADASEEYKEGINFKSRPTAITGFYKYKQDIHDPQETGLVVIRLIDESEGTLTVIGEGIGKLKPSTSFTQFKVPVVYTVRNKKATKLKLMVSSSNHASYLQEEENANIRTTDYLEKGVSTGAELTVDLLTLLYE